MGYDKKTSNPRWKVIATGEKITPLYDDTNTKELENKVNTLETKLDKILNLLNSSKGKE